MYYVYQIIKLHTLNIIIFVKYSSVINYLTFCLLEAHSLEVETDHPTQKIFKVVYLEKNHKLGAKHVCLSPPGHNPSLHKHASFPHLSNCGKSLKLSLKVSVIENDISWQPAVTAPKDLDWKRRFTCLGLEGLRVLDNSRIGKDPKRIILDFWLGGERNSNNYF